MILKATYNGVVIALLPVPDDLIYTLMTNHTGGISTSLDDVEARRVLKQYLRWVIDQEYSGVRGINKYQDYLTSVSHEEAPLKVWLEEA